ncbi:PEP-CTERM sorting domain-containing protein [Alteromonas facilis]|uniref:PEP-CTERM sorting domain-containing protein n=1 Tax=Alteromonas facilis TaxID=2048004 RepID=UPI000C289551|nr:PEP-CTERM sorting domain-containing protein [Alteromonas facilis]
MYKVIAFALSIMCFSTHASLLLTSPTGYGNLGAAIPDFGGAVIDIVGNNNNRVVSFISERELAHVGLTTDSSGYVETAIGALAFNEEMLDALAGGISQIAIRLTMWDGDNDLLNGVENGFHANKNFLFVNEAEFGNFSTVETIAFERFGVSQVATPGTTGFISDYTSVGWFWSDSASLVGGIWDSITSTGLFSMKFVISGAAPGHKNFISFSDRDDRLETQVKSFTEISVPEPNSILLMLFVVALFGITALKTRKHNLPS